MNAISHWNLEGNNRARFRACATLVHLWNNGQVQQSSARSGTDNNDTLEDEPSDDADSASPDVITFFDEKALKDTLLDRVAEVASNAKGGRDVAASVMQTGNGAIKMIIARNDGFHSSDEMFFRDLELMVRHIATHGAQSQIARLYLNTHQYQRERLHIWLTELKQHLARLCANAAPSSQVSASFDTKSTELIIALMVLRKLVSSEDVFRHFTTIQIVTQIARTVWKSHPLEAFNAIGIPKPSRLRESLGYLGRVDASCTTILRAASRLQGFEELRIVLLHCNPKSLRHLKDLDCRDMSSKPWTLQDTYCSLFPRGRDIKSIIGMKWKLGDATARFNSIQKEGPQIHAEIQLLMYLAQQKSSQSSRQEPNWLTYGYIGCSKKFCYLCNEFIKRYDPVFRTRGSHGALYSQWTVPYLETSGDLGGASVRIAWALYQVEQELVSLARKDKRGKTHIAAVKQSSVGGSSCATALPGGKGDTSKWRQLLISSHLDEERMRNIRTLFGADSVAKNTEVELEQQLLSSSSDDDVLFESPTASQAIPRHSFEGECDCGCCRETTRCCSRCGQGYFYSYGCETRASTFHLLACNQRPLTPADFLDMSAVRDEIPDDPDVLEKFGFEQCRDYNERSFFLGLYQGLLNILEVDVLVINSWMEDGTLRENIIKKFEELPQGNRGAYYPWFLGQAHLLNPNSEAGDTVSFTEMHSRHLDMARERYLSLEDQGVPTKELSPWTKRESLMFFSILLMAAYPHPNLAPMWFNLGFCVCRDEHHQCLLGTLYHALIYGNKLMEDYNDALGHRRSERRPQETCSFGEFWTCFGEGKLVALMKRYQLRGALEDFPYLEAFLSIPPDRPRPLVWHLRHLLELGPDANHAPIIQCHEADMLRVARRKFGLDASSGRLNAKDTMILKDFYIDLLEIGKAGAVNPLDLERARVEGRLLEFLLQAHRTTEWSSYDASEVEEVLGKAFS